MKYQNDIYKREAKVANPTARYSYTLGATLKTELKVILENKDSLAITID